MNASATAHDRPIARADDPAGPEFPLSVSPNTASVIARWRVEARFGHKDEALALVRRWWREIAPRIGWAPAHARVLSGSLGVAESAIEVEIGLPGLAGVDQAWARLATDPAQAEWAGALAPHVVSGTPRWTVYRVAGP